MMLIIGLWVGASVWLGGLDHAIASADGIVRPRLYIYPRSESDVTVDLRLDGQFKFTYPPIDEQNSRWNLKATPAGTLTDKQTWKRYPYLFWEAELRGQYEMTREGFAVPQDGLISFLEEKLSHLGLNDDERADFMTYWLPQLRPHRYVYIRFLTDEYTSQADLTVAPRPESLVRIFAVFHPLAGPIVLTPQTLPYGRSRWGFTVVEWAGIIIE